MASEQIVGYRLSPQQARLWALRPSNDDPFWTHCVIRLPVPVDPERIRQAVATLTVRHEILRTCFCAAPGLRTALQVVLPDSVPATVSDRTEAVGVAELARRARQSGLTERPPVRFDLVRSPDTDPLLLISASALVLDGTGARHLAAELVTLVSGATSDDEPVQYVDYAEWRHEVAAEAPASDAERFWARQRSGGVDGTTGTGGAPAGGRPFTPRVERFRIDAEQWRTVEFVAERLGFAPEALLLAAWRVAAAGATGSAANVVRCVVDDRDRADLEHAVGLYERHLPLSAPVSAAGRFSVLAGHDDEALRCASRWREYAIDETEPPLGERPLAFRFDGRSRGPASTTVLRAVTDVYLAELCAQAGADGIDGELWYDSQQIDGTSARRLVERLRMVLLAVCERPERRIGDIGLCTPDELAWLQRRNVSFADVADVCTHELFLARAATEPAATAIITANGPVTVAQVAERAGRVARGLRVSGVVPGDRVGICLSTLPDQLVTVLGAWQVGAAFVALSAEDPPERLRRVVDDARCRLVVADAVGADRLGGQRCPVVPPGETEERGLADATEERGLADAGATSSTTPGHVAYIAYTSGSTGRPHGALVTHRSVVNYLSYVSATFGIGAGDVTLQVAPFTFDAWVRDCLGPLVAGATVVAVDGLAVKSPDALLDAAIRHGVTVLPHVVPTMLLGLGRAAERAGRRATTVRTVLSSGEPLRSAHRVAAAAAFGDSAELVNQYGPTECTMTSTYHRVGDPSDPVPIGTPIPNARIHVCTEAGHPAPIGAIGEIWVGGAGIALGYVGEPGLTADRFVPDPFGGPPGSRLYRTGDLGRFRRDGTLEYLGRRDHQVKVHGVRVEPGEVEARLTDHPEVRDAAVVVSQEQQGEQRLVAAVVPAGVAPDLVPRLWTWLRDGLPPALVPADLVVLDSLPLTHRGKLDRGRIVQAARAARNVHEYTAPRSPMEAVACRLFAELLGLPRVGVHDDFFRLGGHSLLATQAVYELGDAFGMRLPLASIFERHTPAGLAAYAEQRIAGDDADAPVRIPDAPHAPVSFPQRRIWLFQSMQPTDTSHNAQVTVRIRGQLQVTALRRALTDLVARHEPLRTTYTLADGEPVQIVNPPVEPDLPVADLAAGTDPQVALRERIAAQAATAFDLARGPLLRASLVRLPRAGDTTADGADTADHVLLLTVHHIAIDEWSVGILLRDLVELYDAARSDRPPRLPELALRYRDLAAWQRRQLSGATMDRLAGYWVRQLAGAAYEIDLPTDRPRPAVPTARGGRVTQSLPHALTGAVSELAKRLDATMFMILLAAFNALLYRETRATDIAVGSPVAGRTQRESQEVIGCFANILVLRNRLSGQLPFADLVGRVRDTSFAAYVHEDMPFDTLVELLRPNRTPNRMPLVRIWFVLHNTPMPEASSENLELSLLPVDSDTTKFDLNLALTETATGIRVHIEYSTDLFDEATADRLLDRYRRILERVITEPTTRLDELPERVDRAEWKEQHMAGDNRRQPELPSFSAVMAMKAAPVRVSGADLVAETRLSPEQALPAVLTPAGGPVDLPGWLSGNRDLLADRLRRTGAVLLRGFEVAGVEEFQRAVVAYTPDLLDYNERSTPRRELHGKVYTSTEYPPDRYIPLHNESAYSHFWPRTLWFSCLVPADDGGATPVADSREILRRLDPAVRQEFRDRGVMYVRNYYAGFDIPWQVAFQTDDPAVVAGYCDRAGMQYEWRGDNVLHTRHVLDAVVAHPDTGEEVWFNQIHAWHISTLEPTVQDAMRRVFGEGELPRNVRYGDGEPIPPSAFDAIARAYEAATISFPWQRGDVLVLDNMLVAHGREPYRGERKVVVAMSQPYDRERLRGSA